MSDDSTPVLTTTPGDGTEPPAEPPEPADGHQEPASDQEETFDRAYVQQLRDEAAANRVAARRGIEAEQRLRDLTIEKATRGILADPTDLTWSDEMNGEDGYPDPLKIEFAAGQLIERKPHLARPTGNVGQGERDATPQTVSLSQLLRAGA